MGKAALITGSAKRVGRQIVLHLAKQGYDIAIHCNDSKDEAQETKAEIEALGRKAEVFQFDMTKAEEAAPWFEKVFTSFPNLNVLINNASVFDRVGFLDSDLALYQNHMAVNAMAPIFLTQAFAKTVQKGQVINLLDADITKTHGSHFFYLLSKKMLASFTQMAARDLGPDIRVNAVCIGSALPSDSDPENYTEKLKERLPLKELGNVDDVLQAIGYLMASPRTTGQLLFTDSGQHLL